MKGIVPIIILILVVLGIVFFAKNKKVDAPTEETQNEDSVSEVSEDAEGTYNIDTEASMATWTGSKTIIKEYFDTGSINIKSGNIVLTEGQISGGEVVFDMTSISGETTGSGGGEDKLTSHLKSADFFDVENYAEAKYEITEFSDDMVKGNLTIKDKTNPLDIPVSVSMGANGELIVSGTAEVDRTLYDVRYGSGKFFDGLGDNVISDMFTLEFKVVANQ